MSQYELSDLSGISDVMISLIEREKSGSTSDTIKRLAISLGIDDARTLIQWPTDLPEVYK
jgi:transcriptional regulator with XRE-family HTH domain